MKNNVWAVLSIGAPACEIGTVAGDHIGPHYGEINMWGEWCVADDGGLKAVEAAYQKRATVHFELKRPRNTNRFQALVIGFDFSIASPDRGIFSVDLILPGCASPWDAVKALERAIGGAA